MIETNAEQYVKIYNGAVSTSLCNKLINEFSLREWTRHSYHQESDNTNHSYEDDLYVMEDISIDGNTELMSVIWNCINQYVTKDFKNLEQWFDGWNGHSMVRYNMYPTGTRMRVHCDHITTLFDGTRRGVPTLTVLGALNSGYKGGEFLMFGDKEIKLDEGSIVIFPSNFMFPHEVLPVKEGTRYSFVSWVW